MVWDSLAIIEFLADRVGRDRYWPEDDDARGMARSMAAEMHSSFANLRRELPMNVRRTYPPHGARRRGRSRHRPHPATVGAGARAATAAAAISCSATGRAADIMFAPVVTRFVTYGVPVPPFAAAYMKAVLDHPARRRMDRRGAGRALGDRAI